MKNFLLLTAVAFTILSCKNEHPVPDRGVSLSLNDSRKKSISDIVYSLWLDIPQARSEPIQAKVVIDFNLADIRQPVVLDFNADAGKIRSISVPYVFQNEHIIIDPDQLKPGRNTITVEFTAGELSLNRNEDYLYTLFVPDRASTCFPLFDQPNLKATYSLTLQTPEDWNAVANGRLKEKKVENGRAVYSFDKTKQISSYIFSFAAGKFKVASRNVNGRDMTMYYRETDSVKVSKNVGDIFELHSKAIAWLEDYTSIEYPFDKFDFVLLPSFQYGGMEHPGSIFYNESSLFLDDNASVNRKMGRASLIAHETAHMWFGDLVTMDWFNDVWMKEVFANFMAAKIVQPSFPEIDHDLRFLLAHYPSAYSVDRTNGTNPIIQPLDNLKNAGTMYGAIIYQKAPIVMRHLEKMIGEDTMKLSLREYLSTFSYKNAVWNDLVKIIDEKSKRDVEQWSNVWMFTAGMPEYKWKFEGMNDVSQKDSSFRFVQEKDTAGRFWIQPFAMTTPGAPEKYAQHVNDLRTQDIRMTDQPMFVNFDGFSYGYIQTTKRTKNFLKENYLYGEKPTFRASMMINLWEGMLRGETVAPNEMFDILENAIRLEKNPLVADYLLGNIETLYWTFIGPTSRTMKIENTLWNLMINTNDKGMKSSYFRSFRNIAYTDSSLVKLENVWNGSLVIPNLTLSEEDRITLAYELALKARGARPDFLNQQLELVKNPDRKERMQFVMPALSDNEAVRDNFFESLKQEKNREHEAWVLEGLSYLHHPLRAESSTKYLLPSLELLEEIQLTGDIFFPQRWLNTTFEGHNSTFEELKTVPEFLKDHPNYPPYLVRKILQAVDINERAYRFKHIRE